MNDQEQSASSTGAPESAIEQLFGKARAGKEYDFVYAKLTSTWSPYRHEGNGQGNDGGFVLSWGARGIGFGELTVYLKDGQLRCQNECMGARFCQAALRYLAVTLAKDGDKLAAEEGEKLITQASEGVESVSLTDCSGEWSKYGEFDGGQFTILVNLKAGGQEKIVVAVNEIDCRLESHNEAALLAAAFGRLAQDMQLDD